MQQSERMDILKTMLKHGHQQGYIKNPDSAPSIIEVMMLAGDAVRGMVFPVLRELASEEFEGDILAIALRFSATAGMGAVYLWHTDWPLLQREGVVDALAGPRGLDCMDEYVTDLIGIGWDTEESNDLVDHLHLLSFFFYIYVQEKNKSMEDYLLGEDLYKAAFYYGMILEMQRLGLN